jgi:hypothetical protein
VLARGKHALPGSRSISTAACFVLQLYAAIQAGVPVIAVTVPGKGYDFQAASNLLQNLDSELDAVNPGECSRGSASCSADTDTVQLYP